MTDDGESRTISFRYTEFSAPVSRKKRKNNQHPPPPLSTRVEQCRAELEQDNWLSRCRDILKSVPIQGPLGLVCLGLGSPATSAVSRAQLAALIDLVATLDIAKSPSKVSIYDPVFTDDDNTLFGELGFRISPELVNKQDERGTTIFFMPHCDLELYNAVLKANWSEEGLRNLVLIANRLEDYVENKPARDLECKAPYVKRIAPFLRCYPLPPSRTWPAAFNNIAVQYVPNDATLSCISEVVESPLCPESPSCSGYSQ